MYEHRQAYRHANGQVEGFIGRGSTRKKAKDDAVDQIKRKLKILGDEAFDQGRLIESASGLNKDERENVTADWDSRLRY